MREFDYSGLILAEYQGKIFEKSVDLDYSTPIFMRRFFNSEFLKTLDKNKTYLLTFEVNECLDSINEQFGNSTYGKIKYSKAAMFWIGYMYRYIAYTREQPTRFLMRLFDYRQMNKVYYSFHTQSPEWVVASLLDMNNLEEDVFDVNARLKKLIREKGDY